MTSTSEKGSVHLKSRQWSTATLKRGLEEVATDVKQEPWTDVDDEVLKARMEVGPRMPFNTVYISASNAGIIQWSVMLFSSIHRVYLNSNGHSR